MRRKEIGNLLAYSEIIEEQYAAACKSELWVAALMFGCSLAECLLLMRAISSIDRLREVPKYKGLTVEKLCGPGWGLDRLCKLAQSLHWFDVVHVDERLVDALLAKFLGRQSVQQDIHSYRQAVPAVMLMLAESQRNMIHPGRAAALDNMPNAKKFVEDADGFCAVLEFVLQCLRETQNDASLV